MPGELYIVMIGWAAMVIYVGIWFAIENKENAKPRPPSGSDEYFRKYYPHTQLNKNETI